MSKRQGEVGLSTPEAEVTAGVAVAKRPLRFSYASLGSESARVWKCPLVAVQSKIRDHVEDREGLISAHREGSLLLVPGGVAGTLVMFSGITREIHFEDVDVVLSGAGSCHDTRTHVVALLIFAKHSLVCLGQRPVY